jgi:hypothetical protein
VVGRVFATIGLVTVAAVVTPLAGGVREADPSKATCTRTGVETIVRGVLRAFNRGDVPTFMGLIAEEPAFNWFSVGGEPGRRIRSAAFNRASLPRYVSVRHRQRERQQLVLFDFNGRSAGYGHFAFSVIRSARDHPAERVSGKGAVDCSFQPALVAVWSLGDA